MSDPRVWNYRELLQKRDRGWLLGWLAVAAFVIFTLVVIRLLYSPGPDLLTMSSGNTEGPIYQFLLSLAHDAAHSQLNIEPVVTTGSVDMLNKIDAGQLDFAFVQGGFDMDRFRNIRQAAVLSVGPLHLLIKREHHPRRHGGHAKSAW